MVGCRFSRFEERGKFIGIVGGSFERLENMGGCKFTPVEGLPSGQSEE